MPLTEPTIEAPPLEEAPQAAPETAHSVKTRAISGVKVLAARTLVSVLLRVVSSLSLAHLLFPRDYGLFGVSASLTGLGLMLSDVGLGGALIRQNEKPSANETFTVFWTQQALTAVLVVGVIAASPWLAHAYHLSSTAALLLSAMAAGLFFSSLRVVPMLALERDLKYPAIARCELIENLVQTGSTIILALLGGGAWALAGGGLLRGLVGLACVWAASPWRPQGRFEFAIVRRLAKFGIPFQLNTLAPSLLGGWMPLVVSRLLGVAAVGLVGWAINISYIPMMLNGVLNRVAFPAYSRLQSDPEALAGYLRASVRRLNALLCLVVPVFVIVCPAFIPLIFGHRWTPSIVLVQWFSLETVLLSINGVLCATQNAAGFATDRLWVAIGTAVLRAGLGWVAIAYFGLAGLGPIVCLTTAIELFISTWAVVYRHPHLSVIWPEIFLPLLLSGGILALAEGTTLLLAGDAAWMRCLLALGVFLFLTALQDMLSRQHLIATELRGLLRMLRPQTAEL